MNWEQYGIDESVAIPALPGVSRRYGAAALSFLRDQCEELKFDPGRRDLKDSDGRSSGKNRVPYNMERDIDRLSFEAAVAVSLPPGPVRIPLVSFGLKFWKKEVQ